jgi:hypothetical protein
MEKKTKIFKDALKGLYGKVLIKIGEAYGDIKGNSNIGYLPYNKYNSKICRCFCITKEEAREILQIFSDLGYITIAKRGVRIEFELIENES